MNHLPGQVRYPLSATGVRRLLRLAWLAAVLHFFGAWWGAVAAPIVPVGVDRLVSLYSADGLFGTPGCSGEQGHCLRQQGDLAQTTLSNFYGGVVQAEAAATANTMRSSVSALNGGFSDSGQVLFVVLDGTVMSTFFDTYTLSSIGGPGGAVALTLNVHLTGSLGFLTPPPGITQDTSHGFRRADVSFVAGMRNTGAQDDKDGDLHTVTNTHGSIFELLTTVGPCPIGSQCLPNVDRSLSAAINANVGAPFEIGY